MRLILVNRPYLAADACHKRDCIPQNQNSFVHSDVRNYLEARRFAWLTETQSRRLSGLPYSYLDDREFAIVLRQQRRGVSEKAPL
jgi:hypothetical protein